MCGGKSNISDRVAVKRASRARFRQIDVSKTATRLKMHEKPPFVLKYCPPECAKNRHSMKDDGVKGGIGGLRMYEDPPLVRHSQDGRVARRACRKTGTPQGRSRQVLHLVSVRLVPLCGLANPVENRFDHGDRKENCPSGMRLVAEKGHVAKPCSTGDGIDAA